MSQRILILGGDGYLGWPTALRFSRQGHSVAIVDNFAKRAWEQELEGTPFERVFAASSTEVKLLPEGQGTRVTLIMRQQLRGSARMGGFMVRRATGRVLDEALQALEALHGP
jgi:NAD(P)-dependent dehydrogenase (short-subunit alcohol dehydrogenase family)